MNKVAVIDYGMGNLHSVTKAIEYVGRELDEDTEVLVTSNAQDISQSDRVVFPELALFEIVWLKSNTGNRQ